MKFNLKYLILPLSIIGCINTYNINAMEDITNEVNQTPMPWVDFEAVLTSFSNNEQLNNIQIDFIKRIANEITYNVDINDWRSLITGYNIGFPRVSPLLKIDQLFNFNNDIMVQHNVNTTILLNRDLLSYLEKTHWLICLDGIPNNNNNNDINPFGSYDEYIIQSNTEYNEQVNNYIEFINKIKDCYNNNYINKDEYTSLLNWLLYCNVHSFFDTVKQSLLVTWISEKNYQIFNNRFANYLLGNAPYNKDEISLIELYKKYANGLSSENEYTTDLRVINKIIDNSISIYINNSKLKQIKPVDLLKNTRNKVLNFIIKGIHDAAYYKDKNGNEQQPKEYDNILKSQTVINKIDTEFNITNKILESQKYKDYKDNCDDKFKTYYQLLRSEKGSVGKYKSLTNVKQSIKDIITIKNNEKKQEEKTKDIKENEVITSNNNIIKNNNNEPAMPEIIYMNILPFLVHTNLDRESNTNSQTQNNQLHNNINEINTNNNIINNNEGND